MPGPNRSKCSLHLRLLSRSVMAFLLSLTVATSANAHLRPPIGPMFPAAFSNAMAKLMAFQQALKLATQNPQDDWRRQNVQKAYDDMNAANKSLDAVFGPGGDTDPATQAVAKQSLAAAVDPHATDFSLSLLKDEAKLLQQEANLLNPQPGTTLGMIPTGAQADASGMSTQSLATNPNGAATALQEIPKGQASSSTGGSSTQSAPAQAIVGAPLHDLSKLSDLQNTLTGGGQNSDAAAKARLASKDGEDDSAETAEQEDARLAAEEELAAISDASGLEKFAFLLVQGERGQGPLGGVLGPISKALSWTGLYGASTTDDKDGRHKGIFGFGHSDDLTNLMVKWLILPSFLAMLVWMMMHLPMLLARPAENTGIPHERFMIEIDPSTLRMLGAPDSEIKANEAKPGTSHYYVWFNEQFKKWVLVKTDLSGEKAEPVGELKSGTVVRSSVLHGKQSFSRFKLGDDGQWVSTDEKEQYLVSQKRNSGGTENEGRNAA